MTWNITDMGDWDFEVMKRWQWWAMVVVLSPLLAVSAAVVLLVYLSEWLSALVNYIEHLVAKAYDSKLVDSIYRFAHRK